MERTASSLKVMRVNEHELLLRHRAEASWILLLFAVPFLYAGVVGNFHGTWLVARAGFLGLGSLFVGLGLRAAVGNQLVGIHYAKTRIAKDEILDVAVSPAESAAGYSALVNHALRARLPIVGSWRASVAILGRGGRQEFGAALSPAEKDWLVASLQAMCKSRS